MHISWGGPTRASAASYRFVDEAVRGEGRAGFSSALRLPRVSLAAATHGLHPDRLPRRCNLPGAPLNMPCMATPESLYRVVERPAPASKQYVDISLLRSGWR